ncbi:hypothetical protein HYH02_008766 [Chlamydomonas schloesseri]|uniref:Uncharacterized protein n=1 Tax=Chlamydomonas schloesseri TaxID=2026947 RepID=A0A836B2E6_9CHLO|nr:hypothetical protein HYH02_008766 [Chlamydomonas schloesseri]|eukprot:KAG2445299.1 hypothetical protein HYH02_008766 [Chlamydomonas schloesseri]
MMERLRAMTGEIPPGTVLDFSGSQIVNPDFSRVFVRGCYPLLFERLAQSPRRVIITGTPGTGKSLFRYYLLARLVALPEPPPYILWQSSVTGVVWCYDDETKRVRRGKSWMDFEDELQDSKTWYILDAVPAPDLDIEARIILITSPNPSLLKDMDKAGAQVLYMPLWSLDELKECHAKVYGDKVPEELVVQLYQHYGGVPRYVLGLPSIHFKTKGADLDFHLRPLHVGLAKCDTLQVEAGIGALESGPEVSHRVLHIIAKGEDNFDRSHWDFASPWVANQFVIKATKENIRKLAKLVNTTEGAIRGHLHEQLMHRLLPKGGGFKIVRIARDTLARNAEEELVLLPRITESCYFQDVGGIICAADGGVRDLVYYQPLLTNFATVDSLLRQGDTLHLFQMTVSSSGKTVSAAALTKLFEKLGNDETLRKLYKQLRLYFVVPPDVFNTFSLGRASGSWPPNDRSQPQAARIKLYILKGGLEPKEVQQEMAE